MSFIVGIVVKRLLYLVIRKQKRFTVVRNCGVYFGSNRIIGIDGGAVYGGQLNCLELPSKRVYVVKKLKEIREILFLSIFY